MKFDVPYNRIVKIGEHTVELPPLPEKREEILFIDKPTNEAVWRRLDFPAIWYDFNIRTRTYAQETVYDNDGVLISLSVDDSDKLRKLLAQETKRRLFGVHAKIKDKIVWIAPGYYYGLQWGQMKDLPEKYGRYRSIQNDVLILWHYVKYKWDWTYGLVLPKCKKSGITQIMAFDFLNEATVQEGWEISMMSKEYDHVCDVNMAYVFHAYDNLPFIMQPQWSKRNLHEITFGKLVQKTPGRKQIPQKNKTLGNHLKGCKTKPTGFDGPVLKLGWIDEFPKIWEASKVRPDTVHKKVIESVRLQQKKNGALIYTSYMPEIDDKGFTDFRDICKKSRLSTKSDVTGSTESGMIVFELTAVMSNELCFDKWGDCDERKALLLINSENETKTSVSDKQAHRRQYPRTASDMYDTGSRGSVFDPEMLSPQKVYLEETLQRGVRDYVEGNLRWENSLWESTDAANRRPIGKFCNVYMEPLTDEELMAGVLGSLKRFHEFPDEFYNQCLKHDSRNIDDGYLCPYVDEMENIFTGSFDPTDYVLKSDIREGSMNAAHGGFLFNPALNTKFGKRVSNVPIFEYHFRHEDPDDDLEMLIKAMIYFGGWWIIEANKKWVVTSLKKHKMHHFLLLKDADGTIRPYKEGDEQNLVNTTHDMINAYIMAIKRWISPKGGNGSKEIKSLKSVEQLMDFDPTETKKYDLVVSLGYWRLAQESFIVWWEKKKKEDDDGGAMKQAVEGLLNF